VTADASGNLFGTTILDGRSNKGTVFKWTVGDTTITPLVSFKGTNGSAAIGSVVVDSSGNIFGTTYHGGTNSAGTFFEVVAGSGAITTLASFGTTTGAGRNPIGTLLMDSGGNFYGETSNGGMKNHGALFKIAPSVAGTATITILASLTGKQGVHPLGSLIRDAGGNLFATTAIGGDFNKGTAFRWDSTTGTITVLESFKNKATGIHPSGGLVMDAAGDLFGTTFSGGTFNDGTIFKLTAT
jgi:uncharacterized repeat protein (TIGR03803 family)